mgnify:CR=1 FL=1
MQKLTLRKPEEIPNLQGWEKSILVSDCYECEHTGGKHFQPMRTRGLSILNCRNVKGLSHFLFAQ